MITRTPMSRRSLFALAAAAAPFKAAESRDKKIPVGLELFSVRDELKTDLMGTVRGVAKMGYQDVEFFAPYYDWTPASAASPPTTVRNLFRPMEFSTPSN
jgi:hypothetical protein